MKPDDQEMETEKPEGVKISTQRCIYSMYNPQSCGQDGLVHGAQCHAVSNLDGTWGKVGILKPQLLILDMEAAFWKKAYPGNMEHHRYSWR